MLLPTTRNVRQVLQRASRQDLESGTNWYRDTHDFMRRFFSDSSFERAVAALATLSPQCPWSLNKKALFDLVRHGVEGELVSKWSPRKTRIKAWKLWKGEPGAILTGPKVTSFYRCIVDPYDEWEVAVDTHAARAAFGTPNGSGREIQRYLKRVGNYERVADAYRKVAQGTDLLPLEVQAIVWTTWRRLFSKERKQSWGTSDHSAEE